MESFSIYIYWRSLKVCVCVCVSLCVCQKGVSLSIPVVADGVSDGRAAGE